MQQWGTGSAIQQGIQAATAVIQGLAGGNIAQAASGAAAPYLAEQIHYLTTDANGKVNTEANLMAHAVVGVVTAYAAGNSALTGATGAAMGEFIAQQLNPDIKREDLSEEQRQTISALTKAIKRSHIGPSVGDEYKIHGSAKLVISAGYGGGGYLESVLTEDKLSINAGVTKVLGWWAEASIGLVFGPYPIDILKPQYDYAANFPLGIIPIDGSVGKEGSVPDLDLVLGLVQVFGKAITEAANYLI